MWKVLEGIDWTDSGYKIAFFVVLVIFIFALYNLAKFIGKRFLEIFEKLQENVSELKELNKNAAKEIDLIKQEQKFQNEQIIAHTERFKAADERFDGLMKTLIAATKR